MSGRISPTAAPNTPPVIRTGSNAIGDPAAWAKTNATINAMIEPIMLAFTTMRKRHVAATKRPRFICEMQLKQENTTPIVEQIHDIFCDNASRSNNSAVAVAQKTQAEQSEGLVCPNAMPYEEILSQSSTSRPSKPSDLTAFSLEIRQ